MHMRMVSYSSLNEANRQAVKDIVKEGSLSPLAPNAENPTLLSIVHVSDLAQLSSDVVTGVIDNQDLGLILILSDELLRQALRGARTTKSMYRQLAHINNVDWLARKTCRGRIFVIDADDPRAFHDCLLSVYTMLFLSAEPNMHALQRSYGFVLDVMYGMRTAITRATRD